MEPKLTDDDIEELFQSSEAVAGVAFADFFPELRGDVPDEFVTAFELALREYVALAAKGELGQEDWTSDTPVRLAVYPELRERFDGAVRSALSQMATHVGERLQLASTPAPTRRLVEAARNLWSAYLAFNLDPGLLH